MTSLQRKENTRTIPRAASVADRRSFRRVRVPLKARLLLGDSVEYMARVCTISPAATVIETSASPAVGEPVLIYIDRIGRLQGVTTHVDDNTVRIRFDERRSRMARTADTLIWLVNRGAKDPSARRAIRIRQDKAAEAHLDDGTSRDCRILDISVTGASVSIEPRPPVGTILTIGKMRGRVVRHHDSGIGMEFIKS